MIGGHEMDDRLLDISQNVWNDLIEYKSDTDLDSSGCGPASYEVGDGPREHDEEELMSPTNLPNGSGDWDDDGVYDLTECPLDPVYWDYASCVEDFIDAGYSVNEATSCCVDVCYETGWCSVVTEFDFSQFWSCLFPTRGSWESGAVWLSHGICAGTIIAAVVTAGVSTIAIASACAASTYRVTECFARASP